MRNLLDLRQKGAERVKVIERFIFQPRSFKTELIKVLSAIVIIVAVSFGISHADDLNPFSASDSFESATDNFSAIGIVSTITESEITIVDSRGSDNPDRTEYTVNINHLEKVETYNYQPLIISDIKIGDKIVAQGLTNGEDYFIKRIVNFGGGEVAAESVDDIATTTEETSDGIVDTVVDAVTDVVEGITDVVGDVIDAVTGDTEPTIYVAPDYVEPQATTTPEQVNEEEATTTPEEIAPESEVETNSESEEIDEEPAQPEASESVETEPVVTEPVPTE